jgi:hypothetical protein
MLLLCCKFIPTYVLLQVLQRDHNNNIQHSAPHKRLRCNTNMNSPPNPTTTHSLLGNNKRVPRNATPTLSMNHTNTITNVQYQTQRTVPQPMTHTQETAPQSTTILQEAYPEISYEREIAYDQSPQLNNDQNHTQHIHPQQQQLRNDPIQHRYYSTEQLPYLDMFPAPAHSTQPTASTPVYQHAAFHLQNCIPHTTQFEGLCEHDNDIQEQFLDLLHSNPVVVPAVLTPFQASPHDPNPPTSIDACFLPQLQTYTTNNTATCTTMPYHPVRNSSTTPAIAPPPSLQQMAEQNARTIEMHTNCIDDIDQAHQLAETICTMVNPHVLQHACKIITNNIAKSHQLSQSTVNNSVTPATSTDVNFTDATNAASRNGTPSRNRFPIPIPNYTHHLCPNTSHTHKSAPNPEQSIPALPPQHVTRQCSSQPNLHNIESQPWLHNATCSPFSAEITPLPNHPPMVVLCPKTCNQADTKPIPDILLTGTTTEPLIVFAAKYKNNSFYWKSAADWTRNQWVKITMLASLYDNKPHWHQICNNAARILAYTQDAAQAHTHFDTNFNSKHELDFTLTTIVLNEMYGKQQHDPKLPWYSFNLSHTDWMNANNLAAGINEITNTSNEFPATKWYVYVTYNTVARLITFLNQSQLFPYFWTSVKQLDGASQISNRFTQDNWEESCAKMKTHKF